MAIKQKPVSPFEINLEPSSEEYRVAKLIQQRRLQLLITSSIYYDFDESMVPDAHFDKWGRELVELQKTYPYIASQVCYHKDFMDWDGSTGAFLPLRERWVMDKARKLLQIKKKMVK